MDGVLANTEALHARAWVQVLARYGVSVDERFFDRWIGIPNLETARDLVQRFGLSLSVERLIDEREALYLALVDRELRPLPGLAESLAALGLPMAVATSSSRAAAARVLAHLGIRRRFSAVVTIEDVARPKPDPEVYARAAAGLRLAPRECAAVEDSPAGVESARAAGCRVVAVTTTHSAGRLGAAHEVHPNALAAIASIAAAARARQRRP